MLHHYLEFVDIETIAEAEMWSSTISAEYLEIENGTFNGRNRTTHHDKEVKETTKTTSIGALNSSSTDPFQIPILFPSF